jgi:hypothetical protein
VVSHFDRRYVKIRELQQALGRTTMMSGRISLFTAQAKNDAVTNPTEQGLS